MVNALTIDLEDYFQVHAFSNLIRYEDWGGFESRVEGNTLRILDLIHGSAQHPQSANGNPIKATFFCLGWIAKRYPNLIREIYTQGHEIACHGYAHQLIYRQSRSEFRKDIRMAKNLLEDIIGSEVIGYRAPSYSITEKSLWALEILAEEGFKYDSSIFPIRHDFYGIPNAPRFPFLVSLTGDGKTEFKPLSGNSIPKPITDPMQSASHNPQIILEFPLSTVRLANLNLPLSGGGYFRLFPYLIFKSGLRRINEREGRPFIFYLHPWELDCKQPRIREAGLRSRLRHYINLDKTESRFIKLLKEFTFVPLRGLLSTDKSNIPNYC